MSFAINLYNALVIHTLVVHGTKEFSSSTGRIGFFQKVCYQPTHSQLLLGVGPPQLCFRLPILR